MKKYSLTTGKFARRDEKGAVKQGQQEGAVLDQLSNSPVSSVRSVTAVHDPHSSSCGLLAASLEHQIKAELHCEDAISLLQGCRRHVYPVQPCSFQPALQKAPLVMQLWQWRSSCEIHAGDEGISMGLICVRWHPHNCNVCNSQVGYSKASSGLSIETEEQKIACR